MSTEPILVPLSSDEALVLLEWLTRFNQSTSAFEDQAEQRVLWDLESKLESLLTEPFSEDYGTRLAAARARVRDGG